ncbi:radical SAM protein [Clostridium sp. AM58-1XD]|uniref:radical SAM protein n=1 Tax=Clostridium sp. AM58-1XD TaxID=2292307 RepID=UPI0015F7190F|nr:radical SAM protein [Clostridium sp. AM58-1XD]
MYLYKIFRSQTGTGWCYDAVTNRMAGLKGMEDMETTKTIETTEGKGEVKPSCTAPSVLHIYLKDHGLIKETSVMKMEYRAGWEEYCRTLSCGASRLTLELTRRCNMRCSYCIYSGRYERERTHQDMAMPLETAKKAVRLFAEHSTAVKAVCISFYGGEALLEFEKIRKIVSYAEKVFGDRAVYFHIATNGAALTEEVNHWLAENRSVMVDVTVNGYSHDRYRKFPDGRGSLDIIMGNLMKLKKSFPEVYSRQVNFICNYAGGRELEQLRAYYEHVLSRPPALITGIEREGGDEYIRCLGQGREESGQEIYEKLRRAYIYEEDAFLRSLFDSEMTVIHKRSPEQLTGHMEIENCCFPFLTNIFVQADGRLNLCEKAPYDMDMGSVDTGFDMAKTKGLMAEYLSVRNARCPGCWAQRFCTICFKDITADGSSDQGSMDEKCKLMRDRIRDNLALYCTAAEEAPDKIKRYGRMEAAAV